MQVSKWMNDPEIRSVYLDMGTERSPEACVSDALYVWDPYMALQGDAAAGYRRALESAKRIPAAFPSVIASSMRLMSRPDDEALVAEETARLQRTVRRCASLSGLMPFRDAAELRRTLLYIRGLEALGGVYDDGHAESVLSVQRALVSELACSGRTVSAGGRDIRVVLDGSDCMQGEPSVLAKALVISLVRVFGGSRRIDVDSTCDSGSWSFVPGRSPVKDTVRLLMYRPGDGGDCAAAVRGVLNDMKQDRLRDCDAIIVSQAAGLRNSVSLHEDWTRFKAENGVRTFSVIPGSPDAKGLTELSDSVLYIKPEGVLEKDSGFAGFVCSL